MLKVLKSGKPITNHKREFDAIRHGDYVKFIDLVNGPIPFMSVYKYGTVVSGHMPPSSDDISFELLLKAGPSLKIFYIDCLSCYGQIQDFDISDEVYELAAIFEISLRMHAANAELITVRDVLKDVIDKLAAHKSIHADQVEIIHAGRKFLNMIKHNKNQFTSWSEGIEALKKADKILTLHELGYEIG